MKHYLTALHCFSAALLLSVAFCCPDAAARSGDEHPDDIVGVYYVSHQNEESKVRIFRQPDGTYSAQVTWIRDSLDRSGSLRLDEKNPDRSLRSVPCNRIMIMEGLTYDCMSERWEGGKIYDPTRGIRANVSCDFDPDGRLRVRGSLLGISQTIYWVKLD